MQLPWPERGFATPADLAACRESIRTGSRTFFAASLLLPEAVREPALALYAFCRDADDAVDVARDRRDPMGWMHDRLDRIYQGRPMAIPGDRALADVVMRFGLPRGLLEGLLEGFAWDAAGRRYDSLPELRAYAARVAGTVGAMMAMLMGVRTPDLVARACDLGVAMQLSNIARDVGEDARLGRLYLPRQWLREAGIDPDAWLARPVFSDALGRVIHRLLWVADELYERADPGIEHLPLGCRPGIRAARLLYAGIGHEVSRRGLDSVSQRAIVPGPRKARLLALALLPGPLRPSRASLPALAETRFLVELVAAAGSARPTWAGAVPQDGGWWNLEDRLSWVLDLFERVERRRQVGGL